MPASTEPAISPATSRAPNGFVSLAAFAKSVIDKGVPVLKSTKDALRSA